MQRQTYFDFLRGIAIIMVVGIHTFKTEMTLFSSYESYLIIILRSLLNCSVPLFLAISGYFLGSKSKNRKEHRIFLKRQIPKVYIPCLVFSIPYFVLSLYSGEDGYIIPFLKFFFCGFSIYYFIALIIQYYCLLPLFQSHNNVKSLITTSIISTGSILVVSYIQYALKLDYPIIIYAGLFPLWIVFFFMGVFFSKHNRNYNILIPILVCISGLIGQIIESYIWNQTGTAAIGIKLSSFIYSAGIIGLLFSKKVEEYILKYGIKLITYIGTISFGIYLIHFHILFYARKLFPDQKWGGEWLLIICISAILIMITKKVSPRISVKYFGFR